MSADKFSVDDAQRNLPDIVEAIRKEGGRVDILLDGEPVVSLVATRELEHPEPVVEEPPPPRKRARRARTSPKAARLQRAYKRDPRPTD